MASDTFEREVALPVLKEPALRLIRSQDDEESMAAKRRRETPSTIVVDEPMGIVISRGLRDDPAPMVSAYVWGPAPDEDAPEPKAA